MQGKDCRAKFKARAKMFRGHLLKNIKKWELYDQEHDEVHAYVYWYKPSNRYSIVLLDNYDELHPDVAILAYKCNNPHEEFYPEKLGDRFLRELEYPEERRITGEVLGTSRLTVQNRLKLENRVGDERNLDRYILREASYDPANDIFNDEICTD